MKNNLFAYFSEQARAGFKGFFSPIQNGKYIGRETMAAAKAVKDKFKPKK